MYRALAVFRGQQASPHAARPADPARRPLLLALASVAGSALVPLSRIRSWSSKTLRVRAFRPRAPTWGLGTFPVAAHRVSPAARRADGRLEVPAREPDDPAGVDEVGEVGRFEAS